MFHRRPDPGISQTQPPLSTDVVSMLFTNYAIAFFSYSQVNIRIFAILG